MILAAFVVILFTHSEAVPLKHANVKFGVDLCARPSIDPCFPGGKWDPLLNKLVYIVVSMYRLYAFSLQCPYAPINVKPRPLQVGRISHSA